MPRDKHSYKLLNPSIEMHNRFWQRVFLEVNNFVEDSACGIYFRAKRFSLILYLGFYAPER